jgi:hypothetical protein
MGRLIESPIPERTAEAHHPVDFHPAGKAAHVTTLRRLTTLTTLGRAAAAPAHPQSFDGPAVG